MQARDMKRQTYKPVWFPEGRVITDINIDRNVDYAPFCRVSGYYNQNFLDGFKGYCCVCGKVRC